MESIEYRPKIGLGLTLTGVLGLTASVLVWLGVILRPADTSAMSGMTRIFFTAVSIRWFSWLTAALFCWFAWRIGRRCLRAEPTLVVADAGLTLPTGEVVPWDLVTSVEMTGQDLLIIEVEHESSHRATLSSFDLGTDPETVADEIARRRSDGVGDLKA